MHRYSRCFTAKASHSLLESAAGKVRPYEYESGASLANSLAVFKMCEIPPLVNATPTIINIARATGTSPVLHAIVKKTFFRHFCGDLILNVKAVKI